MTPLTFLNKALLNLSEGKWTVGRSLTDCRSDTGLLESR